MECKDPQVPWTDEQWDRVNAAIQEEAGRARVAATFLPLVGPLSPDADFVRAESVNAIPGPLPVLTIEDRTTIQLATLQVEVQLRGPQLADPDLTSALQLFRRAANGLARLEDAVVFNGLIAATGGAGGVTVPRGGPGPAGIWQTRGLPIAGLWGPNVVTLDLDGVRDGQVLVSAVSQSIGELEGRGHFGPFALVLDQQLFLIGQTPDANFTLPQDRIIPFLGGGPLLRSSALPEWSGVMVALGGAPVELVVAKDMALQFLQITVGPEFIFRVYERIVLRIKEPGAISTLDVGNPA